MINAKQLAELIIKPALLDLILFSDDAMALLLFTVAAESQGGTYIHQIKGPALGIYQMEPASYNDLWVNFIDHRNDIKLQLIHSFDAPRMPSEDRMIYDLRFATAMARIYYLRIKAPLPKRDDLDAIWDYYKKYYNTVAGKTVKANALLEYQRFIRS